MKFKSTKINMMKDVASIKMMMIKIISKLIKTIQNKIENIFDKITKFYVYKPFSKPQITNCFLNIFLVFLPIFIIFSFIIFSSQ